MSIQRDPSGYTCFYTLPSSKKELSLEEIVKQKEILNCTQIEIIECSDSWVAIPSELFDSNKSLATYFAAKSIEVSISEIISQQTQEVIVGWKTQSDAQKIATTFSNKHFISITHPINHLLQLAISQEQAVVATLLNKGHLYIVVVGGSKQVLFIDSIDCPDKKLRDELIETLTQRLEIKNPKIITI